MVKTTLEIRAMTAYLDEYGSANGIYIEGSVADFVSMSFDSLLLGTPEPNLALVTRDGLRFPIAGSIALWKSPFYDSVLQIPLSYEERSISSIVDGLNVLWGVIVSKLGYLMAGAAEVYKVNVPHTYVIIPVDSCQVH